MNVNQFKRKRRQGSRSRTSFAAGIVEALESRQLLTSQLVSIAPSAMSSQGDWASNAVPTEFAGTADAGISVDVDVFSAGQFFTVATGPVTVNGE